jgi:hypothetical protein
LSRSRSPCWTLSTTAHAEPIGGVYREYFGKHYPAMTLVEVRSLWDAADGAMIEIEGIAAID